MATTIDIAVEELEFDNKVVTETDLDYHKISTYNKSVDEFIDTYYVINVDKEFGDDLDDVVEHLQKDCRLYTPPKIRIGDSHEK